MVTANIYVSNMNIGIFSGVIPSKNTLHVLYICFLLHYEGTV